MVWLFACFGYSKKRKRLKSSLIIHSQDKGIGSYQPLESPSSCSPEASEVGNLKPIRSNLKRRKQGKASIRKKVRFNLNVIAYEPIEAYGDDDDHEEDLRSILATEWEEQKQETEEEDEDNVHFLLCKGNSAGVKRERPYSLDYRYSNCYDDEDEIEDVLEEDDEFDDEDILDDEDEEVINQVVEDQTRQEPKSDTSRSWCVNPVLVPIENLNQWRAIKMKRREVVA